MRRMRDMTITRHHAWSEWQRRKAARTKLGLKGDPYPAANVGQRHPDYGMTVAEHTAAKEKRNG